MSGTRIVQYSFEDYVGPWPTSGTASPADGYIFTGGDGPTLAWSDHIGSCQINSNDGTRDAYAGTKYFHHQMHTSAVDPYLGNRTSGSMVMDGALCGNLIYPTGTHNTVSFANDITVTGGEYFIFIRFRFRLTDHWDTQAWPSGHNDWPGHKWLRFVGADSGNYPFITVEGGYGRTPAWTTWPVYFRPSSTIGFTMVATPPGIIADGQWHSCCFKLHRINTSGDLEMEVWFDSWDISATPNGTYTWSISGYGIPSLVILSENFNGDAPLALMGIDYDDVEVWDGDVTTEDLQESPNLVTGSGAVIIPTPDPSGVGALSRTYLLDRFDGYGSS